MKKPEELDKLLVDIGLEATAEMSLDEAGRFLTVSHESVNRWRDGDWKRLNPAMRKKLKAKLTELGLYPPIFRETPGRPVMATNDALQVVTTLDAKQVAAALAAELIPLLEARLPEIQRDENRLAAAPETRERKAHGPKARKGRRGSSRGSA